MLKKFFLLKETCPPKKSQEEKEGRVMQWFSGFTVLRILLMIMFNAGQEVWTGLETLHFSQALMWLMQLTDLTLSSKGITKSGRLQRQPHSQDLTA